MEGEGGVTIPGNLCNCVLTKVLELEVATGLVIFYKRCGGLFVLPPEFVLVVCREWLSGMVWKLYYGMEPLLRAQRPCKEHVWG